MSETNEPFNPNDGNHKMILSLRKVRLASRKGHIIIIEAGIPTRIPKALFMEAAKKGCVDYNPQMIKAFETAVATAKEAEEKEEDDPGIDIDALVKDAVRHVMLAAVETPELLTSQGFPRVPAVRLAFDELCANEAIQSEINITTDLIEEYYFKVKGEAEAVEYDDSKQGQRYPDGVVVDNLDDGEVGGDIDEALERVVSGDDIDS